jgi:hypothetical protein
MAKTAVVNKRGRRRRRRNPTSSTSNRRRRRRRNYGAAATINPRRRRRRSYGVARRRPAGRRRRNPVSPYASSGYYRRPNPTFDVMNDATEVLPAATGGVLAARFALRQAGPYEADAKGVLEPGLKHAIAIYLAAVVGSQLIDSVLGSGKGNIAKVSALGFGGDLFLRARFMKDSEFYKNNLSLQGLGMGMDEDDAGYYVPDGMEGFQETSALGSTMTDAFGNSYVSTPQGWQLSGPDDLVVDDAGNVYQLSGGGGARLAGFSQSSPLGAPRASNESSFGYSR